MLAEIQGNIIRWNDCGNFLLMQLYQLYSENFLLDTCLICDHVQMYAHRAVLAAASPFFKQQLSGFGNDLSELRINSESLGVDIAATEVQALLHYIYRGEVHVPVDRLANFLQLGQRLQVIGLHEENQLMDFSMPPLAANALCLPYQVENCPQSFNNEPRSQIIPIRIQEEHNNCNTSEINYTPHPQPYIGVKSLDNLMSSDPPKLCEPLKVDTCTQGMTTSIPHTSFSDLCTIEPEFENHYSNPLENSFIPIYRTNNSYINSLSLEMGPQFVPRNETRDNVFTLTSDDCGQPVPFITEPMNPECTSNMVTDLTSTSTIRVNPLIGANDNCTRDFSPLNIETNSNHNDFEEISLIDSVIANDSEESSRDTPDLQQISPLEVNALSTPETISRYHDDSTGHGNEVIVEKEIINTVDLSMTSTTHDANHFIPTDQLEGYDASNTENSQVDHTLANARGRLKVKDSIGGVSLHDTSQCHPTVEENVTPEETSEKNSDDKDKPPSSENSFIEDKQTVEEPAVEEIHKCTQCSFSTAIPNDLAVHLWEHHNIGKLLKCRMCSFSTVINDLIVSHAIKHLDKSIQECPICGKVLKNKITWKMHIKYHRSDYYFFKCELCSVKYHKKSSLIKHLASQHKLDPDNKPLSVTHKCSECSFTTLAEYKLQSHMMRRHIKSKKYKCKECNYSSIEEKSLLLHQRTHTKEKPHVCDTCDYSSTTQSGLARHKRSHTKEKPYKCEKCGQQYADKKRLRDHVMKHNNIKPFMCHMCGYACRRKDNLQTHVKKCRSNGSPKKKNYQEVPKALDTYPFKMIDPIIVLSQ